MKMCIKSLEKKNKREKHLRMSLIVLLIKERETKNIYNVFKDIKQFSK